MPPIATRHRRRVWSLCVSVTLVHPAKAIGLNEMPFGRDTCVVPSNIVLDRVSVRHGKGRFWGRNFPTCIAKTNRPIEQLSATMPPNTNFIPIFKPPPPVGAGGGYMFSGRPCVPLSVRPCVRPCVRPSVRPSVRP